jgi:hypothetical protein
MTVVRVTFSFGQLSRQAISRTVDECTPAMAASRACVGGNSSRN